MTTVLGLDVSTTTIGYCALNVSDEIKLIDCGFYKPPKTGNLFERLDTTKKNISQIIDKHKPDYIAIEDIIQFFKGHSGAKTIISLAVFNRMIGLLAFDFLNKPPELYNVLQIRHGIRRAAGLKKLPQKEELPDIISPLLDIKYPWIYGKKGKIKVESYDVSDAICVAYHCALILKDKNTK